MPKLENKKSYSLCDLHSKLNLSQSSLASSIEHLPEYLNFTGMIIHYEELQLVGWKKEVLITLSEGCIETLKVSMWLNHSNPVGLRFRSKHDLIGQMLHLQDVNITGFDFTSQNELQFYGEIRPSDPTAHLLMILVSSGASYSRFHHNKTPFKVHTLMSIIPKCMANEPSTQFYPTNSTDKRLMSKMYGLLNTFHHCIAKNITFSEVKNPFQRFINSILQNDSTNSGFHIRTSRRWLRSKEQQDTWIESQVIKS